MELIPQHIKILNQVFELEKKLNGKSEMGSAQRHVSRIKEYFEELGLSYANPLSERYNETRTDCEANIVGTDTANLVITEVIKPIIKFKSGSQTVIVQKGIVIAEGN